MLYRAHQRVKYKSKGGLSVGGLANTPYPSLGIAGGRFAKHSLPHLAEEGFVDPSRLQDFSRKVSRVKIGNPNWILVGSLFTRNTLEILV